MSTHEFTNKILGVFFVLLIVFTIASTGWSATYYVDPGGNDTSGDGSSGEPWATLSYACSRALNQGDTIFINSGTYNDSAQCNLAVGVNIKGSGKDKTVIRSSYGDWYIKAESNPITNGNQTISDFKLDGNNRSLLHGISIVGRNFVTIENLDFVVIQDKAIRLEGYDWWSNNGQDWPPVPPPGYAKGIVVRNTNITGCSKQHDGGALNSAVWLHSLEDCLFDNVVIDESASSGGKGNAMKSWPGWLKHCTIRNSKFSVNPANGEPITIELWNLETDTEIYNNTFNEGYISLVSGRQNGGTWALKFHDNKLINTSPYGYAHELALDFVDFYNNYITIQSLGVWATSHMYSADGLSNIRIRNNIFYNNNGQGITVLNNYSSNIDNLWIYNNVFDTASGSSKAGVLVFPSSNNTYITNLKIINNNFQNLDYGVYFSNHNGFINNLTSPIVKYNNFSNVKNSIQNDGATNLTSSNNLFVYPEFTMTGERSNQYYRLNSKSPLINAGENVGLPFNGPAPDIGAFEIDTIAPPTGLRIIQ